MRNKKSEWSKIDSLSIALLKATIRSFYWYQGKRQWMIFGVDFHQRGCSTFFRSKKEISGKWVGFERVCVLANTKRVLALAELNAKGDKKSSPTWGRLETQALRGKRSVIPNKPFYQKRFRHDHWSLRVNDHAWTLNPCISKFLHTFHTYGMGKRLAERSSRAFSSANLPYKP